MVNWRKSRGHMLFLRLFLRPRNIDDLPPSFGIEWKLMLGEEPKTAIKRLLDSGVLVPANLSEHLNLKFRITELKDMLRNRALSPSGNKHELILRLIQESPEDMKQAVMDLAMLKCSEQGEQLVEDFLTTEGEPPIRDDMFPTDKVKTVAKWILGAVGAGLTYDALKRLAGSVVPAGSLFIEMPKSVHNPHEYDAEYILILGGQYNYYARRPTVCLPDMYFAKYPVTNRRHRRFIRYLEEREHKLLRILPKREFDRRMIEFTSGIKGFTWPGVNDHTSRLIHDLEEKNHGHIDGLMKELASVIREQLASRIKKVSERLGDSPNSWPKNLRSAYDRDKRFAGEEQPVVGISWYGAKAYCLWLTELMRAEAKSSGDEATGVFRLPQEVEWVWAASGGERTYPWGHREPNDTLANHGNSVGATTPVGSYPDGATPEGLMDMAGNVWEWMEREGPPNISFGSTRGGFWGIRGDSLCCSTRGYSDPDGRSNKVGFRVVRAQS